MVDKTESSIKKRLFDIQTVHSRIKCIHLNFEIEANL